MNDMHPALLVLLILAVIVVAFTVPMWGRRLPQLFPALFLPAPSQEDVEIQGLRDRVTAAAWAAALGFSAHTSLITMLDHWEHQVRTGAMTLQAAEVDALAWVKRRELEHRHSDGHANRATSHDLRASR